MKTFRSLSLVVAFVLAAALAATAPGAAAAADLDQRLSLDLEEAAPRDVFAAFAQMQELDLVLDPAVDEPISVRFDDITARTAITAICESIRCRWRVDDGVLHVVPAGSAAERSAAARLDERVDLDLEDARLGEIFRSFASLLGARLEIADPLADLELSIQIEDRTAAEAMDAVCRQGGCRWSLDQAAGEPVLRVIPAS